MDQTERLYKIKSQLDAGRCLRKAKVLEEFNISPATFKRDLAHLRDRAGGFRPRAQGLAA